MESLRAFMVWSEHGMNAIDFWKRLLPLILATLLLFSSAFLTGCSSEPAPIHYTLEPVPMPGYTKCEQVGLLNICEG